MKKREKKIDLVFEQRIIIIVILILIIVVASIFVFMQYKAKMAEKGYPIHNIVNNHEELTKEHCFEDICIKGLTIAYYKDSVSSIYGTMYSTSREKKDACVKIQFYFDENDDTQDFNTCYYDLDPEDEVFIETYFDEDQRDLVFASGYRLMEMSSSEKDELYQSRDEELEHLKK